MKLCECGCGKPTNLATKTDSKRGYVKGEPFRFLPQHHFTSGHLHHNWVGGKTKHKSGYVQIRMPEHPRTNSSGYVMEHIVVAENALGRFLPPRAEVHHFNEDRTQNQGSNLVICENRAYHCLLHLRLRAYRATGNPEARKCKYCKKWDMDVRVYKGGECRHGGCQSKDFRNGERICHETVHEAHRPSC